MVLVGLGTTLIAGTYGLVRLAFGLLLPDMQASLALDDRTAGYISSGASLAYCVGATLGLGAARHPRLVVVGAAATACGGAVGMALAPDVATFAPLAVLSSVGAGLASPGLVAVVARNVPVVRRDRAQAVVNTGTGVGLVAAGALALVLLPDWRLVWALAAVVTAAAATGVLLLDRPSGGASPEPDGADGADGADGTAVAAGPWLRAHTAPFVLAVLLGTASAVVWTYGRSHLVAAGASQVGSVVAWIALGAGGAAAIATVRPLSALPAARAWSVTVGAVAGGILLLRAAPDHLVVALAACAVFGWGFTAATSALIAWATKIDAARAAGGTSVLFVALVLGQAVGSSAAGVVADRWGLTSAFVLATAVAVLAAVLPCVPDLAGGRSTDGRETRKAPPERGLPSVSEGGLEPPRPNTGTSTSS